MAIHIRRREFIFTLGGAAAAWPLAARAQQGERMRRVGMLMSMVESDPRGLEYITAFAQGLAELGWKACGSPARALETQLRHGRLKTFAAQKHCLFLR